MDCHRGFLWILDDFLLLFKLVCLTQRVRPQNDKMVFYSLLD